MQLAPATFWPNTGASMIPPIAITAVVPVAVFLTLYGLVERFRRVVLSLDIRDLTMLQLWRVVGLGFLMLYAHNVLPATFALPAGLGDVAVGIAAIFVFRRLNHNPDYARSSEFVRFNLLGFLDFAIAIVTSGLASGAVPALVFDGVTSAPMDVWPLSIFPSFIVPGFIILHLMTLFKVRELRRQVHHPRDAALAIA